MNRTGTGVLTEKLASVHHEVGVLGIKVANLAGLLIKGPIKLFNIDTRMVANDEADTIGARGWVLVRIHQKDRKARAEVDFAVVRLALRTSQHLDSGRIGGGKGQGGGLVAACWGHDVGSDCN